MHDMVALATETVTFLAPFLPYLMKAGESVAAEAGKKIGEKAGGGAWDKAQVLWAKLRPKAEAKGAAQEAVEDVAADPNNKDALAALRLQLKKLFAEDESLARDVYELHKEAQQAGVNVAAIGDYSVAVSGNVSGSTIIAGNSNRIGDD